MLAKKSLGQNFLINKSKIKKIVDSLDLKKGDVVIEIGPGHGELTEEIRNEKLDIKVIAIEKDGELAQQLGENFQFSIFNFQLNSKLEIQKNKSNVIIGDALNVLPLLTENLKSYKLVGNIPYYITGYLFRIIGDLDNKPSVVVFTIQKEVAQRICVKKGKMNLLSASVQFWAEPKIIDIIPKGNFRPIPKVDSAIMKLSPRTDADMTQTVADNYFRFIKILFKQPRKTILNNVELGIKSSKGACLSGRQGFASGGNYELRINKEEITVRIKNLGINPLDRPQDLNIEQIIQLSTLF